MKITTAQREALLGWVVQGLPPAEINEKAAAFDPPFEVSRQQINFYRKSRAVKVREIREQSEDQVLTKGLATIAGRVRKLMELAVLLEEDLFEKTKIWLRQRRAIGSGDGQEFIVERVFNEAEVKQYRGILDDIAREKGERKQSLELEGDVSMNIVRLPAKLSAEEWQRQNSK